MLFTPEYAFQTDNGIGFKHTVITDTQVGVEFVWVPNESPAFERAEALLKTVNATA
jgi:hypothetical protein